MRGVGVYSLHDAARIARVPPARLRAWARSGLVTPLRGDEPTFGFRELGHLRALGRLVRAGVPLGHIRRSVARLRERLPDLPEPLAALDLWPAPGARRIVARHGGVLLEPDGQLVMDLCGAPAHDAQVASLAEARAAAYPPEPRDAVSWFEEGCKLDGSPHTRGQARAAYERAVELAPGFADAWCNLGTVLYQEGDRDAARAAYERAIACEADHVEAHLNLAGVLEEAGRPQQALRHYRAAMRADPLRAEVQLALALLYESLRLMRRARQHWRRYLQLDPAGGWAAIARRRLRD